MGITYESGKRKREKGNFHNGMAERAFSSPLTVWKEFLIFSLGSEHGLPIPLLLYQECLHQLGILLDSTERLSEGFNRFANFEPVENNPRYNVHFRFLTTPTGAAAKTAWMQTQRRIPNNICQNQAVSLPSAATLGHTC